MATLTNLGFETAGATPGSASGWTYTTLSTARGIAGYLQDATANEFPWEGFEGRWSSNEDYLFAFVPLDLTSATYVTFMAAPKTVENFEEHWSSNHGYAYGLASAAAAYDTTPQNFEDFEEEWASNESYLYAHGPLTAAIYAPGASTREFFEEGWSSNESYIYTFSGTAALYDTPTEAFEDFEEDWPTVVMATV
jgi:hypothetical protein